MKNIKDMALRIEFYLIDKIEDLKPNIGKDYQELMNKAQPIPVSIEPFDAYQELYGLFKEMEPTGRFTKILELICNPRLFEGEPEFESWNYFSYILHSEAASALMDIQYVILRLSEDSDGKEFVNNVIRTVLEQSVLLKKDILIFAD